MKTIHKAILGLALAVTPYIAQADLSVRERNFALGGLVVGALIGNAMQPNAMPQINAMPMYNMQAPVQYVQPVMPAMGHCEVRQYRHGYVQNCYPPPPVTRYYHPHHHHQHSNVNIYYSR